MKQNLPEVADRVGGNSRRSGKSAPEELPPVSPAVVRWFVWYSRRYLRRHVHALRVSRGNIPSVDSSKPLVIYLNHAAWWDPLVVLMLTQEFFPGRMFFAPMEARALERYGIFRRIGCFGVELGSLRGAKQFLRASLAALERPDSGLCITPQGRFADIRERPIQFESGLGQLASRATDAVFLPLALEYVFWEERLPEVLAGFGEPLLGAEIQSRHQKTTACTQFLEEQLSKTQDSLAADSLSRDTSRFTNILSGNVGVGGIYDGWRRFRSWVRGERFIPEHSTL